jgi:hypothetical protein
MIGEEKMSNTKELKDYLIGDDGFLLDETHNGKTIMLSGAWGAGKTHFWQNEIEPKLSKELKKDDKSSTYISLYGKDSLNALKQEVFIKASSESSPLSKEVATFGFEALSSIENSDLSIGKVISAAKGLNSYRKTTKGIKRLKDGGVICFDDFERKSKEIDLNDLFGFISQLAIEYQCKVVIILNSDVFEGEEKNIFKTVKEKTVNKFFYFEPSIEELFHLIANDDKYNLLEEYKAEILNAISESEELNARIYIQVLDNCLEWINKGYDDSVIRTLVLNTVCFIQNNFVLSYYETNKVREANTNYKNEHVYYDQIKYGHEINKFFRQRFNFSDLDSKDIINTKVEKFFNDLDEYITGVNSSSARTRITSEMQKILLDEIDENYDEMQAILKFGYVLFVAKNIDEIKYRRISNFIETGILPKKIR